MDGQTERINHILEDMLRMYVREQPSNGRNTYTWFSLHTTTTTKLQQNSAHLRFCMVENTILPSHGVTPLTG